jgi:hypothetical protein
MFRSGSISPMLCFMQPTVSNPDASSLRTTGACAGIDGFAIVRVLLLQRIKSLIESTN